MRTLKSLFTISFLAFTLCFSAQNMQEGFTYLETGQYAKAEQFFNDILKDYPNNKCYLY